MRPSTTLLSVRGFDPATNRYVYTVNERFGATSAGSNAIRIPFQVGIQLRYTLGQSGFAGAFGGGRARPGGGDGPGIGGGARGGAAGGGEFANRFGSLIPNPIREILELRIGLKLSDDQEKQLTVLSDSIVARNTTLAGELQTEMAKLGANADGARMMAVVRPRRGAAQRRAQAALDAAKAILTAEQWNYLPDRLKIPRGQGGGAGQRRVPPGSD